MGLHRSYMGLIQDIKNNFNNLPDYRLQKNKSELLNIPIGIKGRALLTPRTDSSTILNVKADSEDRTYSDAFIMHAIENDNSIVVIDKNKESLRKFKGFLQSRDYKVYDFSPGNNSWSFFDSANLDTTHKDAFLDAYQESLVFLSLFEEDMLYDVTDNHEDYMHEITLTFSAIRAYIATNKMLKEDKYSEMIEFINGHSIQVINDIFKQSSDVVRELWFDHSDTSNKERLIHLKKISNLLSTITVASDGFKEVTGEQDVDLRCISGKKTAFFISYDFCTSIYQYATPLTTLLMILHRINNIDDETSPGISLLIDDAVDILGLDKILPHVSPNSIVFNTMISTFNLEFTCSTEKVDISEFMSIFHYSIVEIHSSEDSLCKDFAYLKHSGLIQDDISTGNNEQCILTPFGVTTCKKYSIVDSKHYHRISKLIRYE